MRDFGINIAGSNWVISGMWVQHTSPVWAAGTNSSRRRPLR
jgi:hypothetical protein